jgi:hypothetical protein
MASIINERDKNITESPVRIIPTGNEYVNLSSSAQYFKVGNDGVATPSQIVFTASLVGNLSGTCTFSIVEGAGAATLVTEGNTATLLYSNMSSDSVTIRATLERLNNTYTADLNVAKLENGTIGTSGDSVDIIFKRYSETPPTPASSAVTPSDWYSTTDSIPVDTTMPIWSSVGTKAAGQTLYVWQQPVALEGGTVAEVSIFRRSAEALDAPTGGSYNFTTKTLTPPTNWSNTVPSGNDPVYISRAVASIYGVTGQDTTLSWTTPAISFQSAAVLSLISDADVIPANDKGMEYLLPTGNALKLYVGNTLQQTNVTFAGTATKGGLTLTVNAATGAISLSGNLWGTKQESFIVTATYAGIVYETAYTISKAIAGSTTTIPDLVSGTDVVYANSDGTGYTLPTGNSLKLYKGATVVSTGVTYAGTVTKNGLTATINATTGAITLSGANWTTNSEAFTFTALYDSFEYSSTYSISKARAGATGQAGTPGVSNILADLSSETGLVAATSDGVLTGALPSNIYVSLYSGTTKLLSGITYSVKVGSVAGTDYALQYAKIESGLRLVLDKATGLITFNEESTKWVSDTVTFTITATHAGISYVLNYTISKLKAGSANIVTNLVGGENVIVPSNSTGTVVTLPPASTFQLFKGDVQVTTGANYLFELTSTESGQYAGYWYRAQNGLILFLNKTTGEYFFVVQTTAGVSIWNNNSETFKLYASYNGVSYKKSVTITKVKSADSSVSILLASEADVVSADSSGSGYLLPSGNSLRLFVGADWVTSGVTYAGGATKNGLTLSISSAGNITLSGTAWTTTQESFTVTATYNSLSYTKIYSITKSVAGSDVVLLDLASESGLVSANADGTGYVYPTGNQALLYKGGSILSTGISYNISGGTVNTSTVDKSQSGLTLSINKVTGFITLSGTSWVSNQESFTIIATYNSVPYSRTYIIAKAKAGATGEPSVIVDLKAEADVVFADSDGGSYTYPSGNALRLYIGNLQQVAGVTYTGDVTKGGLTANIDSYGTIVLSGAQWTTNQESFDFTATYAGKSYTATYIITKAKQGSSTVLIDLLSEADVVSANSDGTGYAFPTNNLIRLYKGATRLASGVVYGGSVDNRNGLKIAVNNSTGLITLSNATGTTWTSDQEFFDLTATYSGIEYSARYSITKSKNGINGVSVTGNSVRIAYTKTNLTNLAPTPLTISTAGNATYPPNDSWGTGTVWGATPPVLVAGQSLYQSNGIYNAVTNQTIWDVPYLSNLKVGALSAISADLGTITAGSITGTTLRIGTAPAVSGSSMSGVGLQINTNGTFAMGNNSTNLSFDGQRLTLNGDIVTSANIQQGAVTYINTSSSMTNYAWSTSASTSVYPVLQFAVYCDGSAVSIFADLEQRQLSSYKAPNTAYTSGRGSTYRVMYRYATSSIWEDIYTQNTGSFTRSAFIGGGVSGYVYFGIVVTEEAIPAGSTLISYSGTWGFRYLHVTQTKR